MTHDISDDISRSIKQGSVLLPHPLVFSYWSPMVSRVVLIINQGRTVCM